MIISTTIFDNAKQPEGNSSNLPPILKMTQRSASSNTSLASRQLICSQFSESNSKPASASHSSNNHFEFDTSGEFLNAQIPFSSQDDSCQRRDNIDSLFQSQQNFCAHPSLTLTFRVKTYCDNCPARITQQETGYCRACNYDICQKCYRNEPTELF